MKTFAIKLSWLLGPALCCAIMTAQAQQPARSAPQIVHTTCYMCHTEHGNDPYLAFVPRLAAQNATYIQEQLEAFRDGRRADPPAAMYMWPMTQNLTDEQIKEAADWFASQPPPTPFPADKRTAEGHDIFEKGILTANVPPCSSCHGPKAEGNGIFPRLAGQNPQYLLAQLRYFRSGVRNDKGADIMKPIAMHLTDSQMKAVADYLGTL